MKKKISKFLAVLIALVLILSCAPVVRVQATEADLAQVWTDDFSSGKGGSYTPYGYWWNMDGQLTVGDPNAGSGVCYYWLRDYVWTDFVMEFDVINQTSEFGVILRAQKTTPDDCQNQGYGVLSDTDWAFFMAETGTWSGFDALVSGERWTNPVEGSPWATQPGAQNVHWKIVARGNRIEVYFNDAQTPSMAMDATLYASGAIGFRTNNPGGAVTAVVDNLTITELHTLSKVDAKAPTCTEDGCTEYYACATCNRKFADAEGTALAENVTVPASHTLTKVESNASTCTGSGNVEYYHCDVCGKNFSDESATNELEDVHQSAAGHCMTRTEAVEPTATEPGNIAYYTCTVCGKLYADAQGTRELRLEDIVRPALGVPDKELQVWEDDFSSGKGDSYIPHGYWWNLDGQLTVGDTNAGPGVCYYWLKDLVWEDFVMEFDVLRQSAEFGVIIRAQDNSPHDSKNQGYGILYDTDWAFFMAENGSFTTFNDSWAQSVEGYPYACQPGAAENVHWKIVAEGNTISVYFNHAETPSMVMKSELWESGYIGFRTNNPGGAVTAVVDNLTIRELGAPKTGDEVSLLIFGFMGISTVALAVLLLNKRRFL